MRISGFGRYALTSCVAAAMLVGCGSAQSGSGVPLVGTATAHRQSHAGGGDLLYVAAPGRNTYMFSWPSGKPIGQLNHPSYNLCSDTDGNVWVLDGSTTLYEYAHGGTSPINTLSLPGKSGGYVCSVDPVTGNLAVLIEGCTSCNGDVAVYADAKGSPTMYSTEGSTISLGYDNQGNLFAGTYTESLGWTLAEMPKGGSSFTLLHLNLDNPGTIQWDGKYLAVEGHTAPESPAIVYRIQVSGSNATIVSTVSFVGVENHGDWYSSMQGGHIAVPYAVRGLKYHVGIWSYPRGGKPSKVIKNVGGAEGYLTGATVSVGSSR